MTTNDNEELSHVTESAIESDVTNEIELNEESFDFEELEYKLESDLIDQLAELDILEDNAEQIGNPESLGDVVANVVWEQVINQIGVNAGEDFIKKNRGLKLDLRDKAHIQTTENFKNGNIATHNTYIDYQKRYDDWQSNFVKDENGNIITKYDRIDNEEKPVLVKGARDAFDKGRPKGSKVEHEDHTVSVGERIRDPEANAHMSKEEQIASANSEANLNPLDSAANESKGDHKTENWLNSERNGEKPAERFNIDEEQLRKKDKEAREEYEKRKKEGEQRSIETGKKSQKEEALRISGAALKSVLMGMLADLIKTIIRKLIDWFRSTKKNFKTFMGQVICAIEDFFKDIKNKLLTAGNTLLTTLATAILGPVVNTIKKAWIFLKQGYSSLKEAIDYIKNPANKTKSFSILMFEVGKIVVAGLTAGGAILLGEVIQKGLMTIPVFAFEIPLFGSLASILGIFFGALVSGIIGAIALNFIDKAIAKKKKQENMAQQIAKRNEILTTQNQLIETKESNVSKTATNIFDNIRERHDKAAKSMYDSITTILDNTRLINEQVNEVDDTSLTDSSETENSDKLDQVFKDLKEI